jgi:hypothetical protein
MTSSELQQKLFELMVEADDAHLADDYIYYVNQMYGQVRVLNAWVMSFCHDEESTKYCIDGLKMVLQFKETHDRISAANESSMAHLETLQ